MKIFLEVRGERGPHLRDVFGEVGVKVHLSDVTGNVLDAVAAHLERSFGEDLEEEFQELHKMQATCKRFEARTSYLFFCLVLFQATLEIIRALKQSANFSKFHFNQGKSSAGRTSNQKEHFEASNRLPRRYHRHAQKQADTK